MILRSILTPDEWQITHQRMKVVIVSKALVVGAYQRKLEELAACGLDLVAVVPPSWRDGGHELKLEPLHLRGFRLRVEPIRFNGHFHLFHYPTLGRVLREERPDLVHVDEEPYNLSTFLAVRQALAVGARPVFFTWQNLNRAYPPPFRWFEQYVHARVSHAIVGSQEAAAVLRAKGYRGRVSMIPQFGVDPQLFSPCSPRPPGPFAIGFAGRLVPEKGLLVLIEALAGLDGDWRLRVYGQGPVREPALARVAALGLADRAEFHQSVPSVKMPEVLRGFDALVLPSLTRPNWKEQFGRVLIEAMACGVPVVGSDSGEIPNLIGDAGLVAPEGDAVALRACLGRLLTDAELRRTLAERGRARVLERYTHARIAAETMRVYQRVVSDER